ncbi:MAG TPA: glycosyltransferase 87 family protein [Solirubrobacteraceae bacterium]|nr:glycosyltransferase 87 family protein [Solirubrobacteraceae bacterium]
MAAIVIFVIGAVGLSAVRHSPPLPVPRSAAIHDALHSRWVRRALSHAHWDRVVVDAIDNRLERVAFFDRGQILAQVALRHDGSLAQSIDFKVLPVPYGDWIAFYPPLLLLLAGLFVLVTGVAPWRRLRNLDVAFALTLVAPVVLLQHRYVNASVLSALPGLLYLFGRCATRALAGERAPAPSTPLLDVLTPEWDPGRRVRLLRILLVALVLAFLMVTVSSVDAVDVLYAVMEGATKLLGGVLPYGHMPGDILHGDTYPLLSYLVYVPLAWVSPVNSTWDSVDLGLALTVATVVAVAWVLFRANSARPRRAPGIRRRHGGRSRDPGQAEHEAAGLRAAVAWLSFPPVLVIASSGTSDVVLAAMLVFALLLWRRPAASSAVLAAGAWFKLAPVALLPIRLAPLRGRCLAGALGAVALVTLVMGALLVGLGGLSGVTAMLHAMAYQFSRGSPQSIWSALGILPLQPVGEAATLALVAGAVVRLWQEPQLAEDPRRMAALSAAVLIALQLAANYWAFLYVVWVVPLLGLSLLAEPSEIAVTEPARAREPRPTEPRAAGALA